MRKRELATMWFLAESLAIFLQPVRGLARPNADTPGSEPAQTAMGHDGQHDFDFEEGTWKIHLKRRLNPLAGSTTWQEFDGNSVTRKVWGGRAFLEEFETNGAAGHIEGLTLRLYNPDSHQWNLYWVNSKDGELGPPMIGEFQNGRGEFFDQEFFNGRAIYVRYVWSDMTAKSAHFEQSFSDDGGKTWEVNWITDQTRADEEAENSAGSMAKKQADGEQGRQHDFDFEIGTWKTHLSRLVHPLTGSKTWAEYEGTTVVRKVWGGRANLVELVADGPAGHFEGLNLRLYHPETHQWRLNFASARSGSLNQPTIGEFKNGRGEFYDQEPVNGRAILVRFVITRIAADSCRFEQAFSDDGGKTWEVNWVATDTRVKE